MARREAADPTSKRKRFPTRKRFDMARQFFSGRSIEQAVLSAASHYGLDPERVEYRLRDKKTGFIKTRRKVVIEVDPESPEKVVAPQQEERKEAQGESIAVLEKLERQEKRPEREAAPRRESPREDRREDRRSQEEDRGRRDDEGRAERRSEERPSSQARQEEAPGVDESVLEEGEIEALEAAEDREVAAFELATERIIELLDIELEVTVVRRDDIFEIELEGPDAEVVTADSGSVLEAMEHLLPRLVRGYIGRGLPCRVDCDGFRADRQQELLDLADEAAAAVKREGRGLMLEPMNPADRRVIHLALADDPGVETESDGSGYIKRVRILPKSWGEEE